MVAGMVGCGGNAGGGVQRGASDTTCDGKIDGPTYITVWFHGAPDPRDPSVSERDTLEEQVAAFNRSQREVRVRLVTLPRGDYNRQVRAAAASGSLPDVLDLDGPYLYNYAWSGKLKPLGSCVPQRLLGDLLPSIRGQGTYAGRLWGLGTFDSGLGLYVRPSVLRKVGARLPTDPGDAWSAAEFTDILHRLRRAGYRRPLDLKLNYLSSTPEWAAYGFAPAVWSAGGDLVDRHDYRKADGVMNGSEAVEALTTIQHWVSDGLVDPNRDDAAFVKRRSPISWVGHWLYPSYSEALLGDLAIVPLPDFGRGTVTGMGSWQWGITANTTDGDAAWRFLEFLLQPQQVRRMSTANGGIPATVSVARSSETFGPGGAEHLFLQQLQDGIARPRPQTPAYPAITAAFGTAVREIFAGRPVKPALDAAANRVDEDLDAHQGYPAPEP
ncbi:extracellular solute-binding protein [Solirubrobacter ginsenosidimutans]|uniref:Extracellular solute-binding protein n=1 Tax=Solirubrobacter ginsenosidimutans TaxID=490573 RepID=A0A9X3SBC0_9ACTN|nr:extracellular solute-binding protein [Solirubrobacter ginsenosidimutans]MDA0166858.1 extracellular solute-binding protein [Solirubrobacter ginsenosidimutans]